MKILGEANNRALARNYAIHEVLLRGDPRIFLMPSDKNLPIKFLIHLILIFNSILNLTINNNELLKTSQ